MRGRTSRSVKNSKKIISNTSVKDTVNVNTNNTIITKRVGARSTPIIKTTPVQQTVKTTPVQQTATPKTIVPQRTIGARNTPIIKRTVQQTPVKPIVKTSEPKLTTAGIVAAAPGAAERVSGNKPVSTHLFGGEIKYDEEGRMDLSRIKDMNIFEAAGHGGVATSEQIIGMGKDVIYGVAVEDQKQVETGLDLVLNPLLKPFADPKMKTEGVIKDEWYWPEELKFDNKSLPPFMQKSERKENQSFIEGISSNIGNIGAIIQSDQAAKIRDEEFATSVERFNTSPATQAYYIGSALGEIPYFLIGAGQVKLAGTIAAKTAAVALRGGLKGTTGLNLMKQTIFITSQASKLEKAVKTATKNNKLIKSKTVTDAVETLKKGYNVSNQVIKKHVDNFDDSKKILAKNRIEETEIISKNMSDSFGKNRMDNINNMKEGSEKQAAIKAFNDEVANELVPKSKQFANAYYAEIKSNLSTKATGSKTEWLARKIQGSPKDIQDTIDRFFNLPVKTLGDSSTILENETIKLGMKWPKNEAKISRIQKLKKLDEYQKSLSKSNIEGMGKAGKYEGAFGNLRLGFDLHTDVIKSAVNFKNKRDLEFLAEGISSITKGVRVFNVEGKEAMYKKIDVEIKGKQKENINLTAETKRLTTIMNKSSRKESKIEMEKIEEFKKTIQSNQYLMSTLQKSKKTLFRPSFPMNISYPKDAMGLQFPGPTTWVIDLSAIEKKFPAMAESLDNESIYLAYKPSVSIQKRGDNIIGIIGDSPDKAIPVFVNEIPYLEAKNKFGPKNVNEKTNYKNLLEFVKFGKGRTQFKSLLLKKGVKKERVISWYIPKDNIADAGTEYGWARGTVRVNKNIKPEDLSALKRNLFLRDFTGNSLMAKLLDADPDGQHKLLEYIPFEKPTVDEVIKKSDPNFKPKTADDFNITVKFPDDIYIDPKDGGNEVSYMDVKIARTMFERRPDEVIEIAKEHVETLTKQKELMQKQMETDIIDRKKKSGSKASYEKTDDKYKEKLESIDAKIKTTTLYFDIEKVNEIQKNLRAYNPADPVGQLVQMTETTFKRLRAQEEIADITNVIKNKKTGKTFWKGPNGTYEVLDTSRFDMDTIITTKNIQHSKNLRTFVGKGMSYFDEKIIEKTPDSDTFGLGRKVSARQFDEFGNKDTSDINEHLTNWVNINDESTYNGIIRKLTPEEEKKQGFGIIWKQIDSINKKVENLKDKQKPKTEYVEAGVVKVIPKSKKQIIKDEIHTLALLKVQEKLYDTRDTIRKIKEKISKGDWELQRFISTNPNKETLFDHGQSYFSGLTTNQSKRNTLGDGSLFAKIIHMDLSEQRNQPHIPTGVQINRVYDTSDIGHLVGELEINQSSYTGTSPTGRSELSRYEKLEEALQQKYPRKAGSVGLTYQEEQFRKLMVNLVVKKGIGRKAEPAGLDFKSQLMKDIINPDDSQNRYKTMVEDHLKGPSGDKYFTNDNIQKGIKIEQEVSGTGIKKRGRRKSTNKIRPSDLYLDVNFDTSNLVKRHFDNIKKKIIPNKFQMEGSEAEFHEEKRGVFGRTGNMLGRIVGKINIDDVDFDAKLKIIRDLNYRGVPFKERPKWIQGLYNKAHSMGISTTSDALNKINTSKVLTKEEINISNKIKNLKKAITEKEDILNKIKPKANETYDSYKERKKYLRKSISYMKKKKNELVDGYSESYNISPHYFKINSDPKLFEGETLRTKLKTYIPDTDPKVIDEKTVTTLKEKMTLKQLGDFFQNKYDKDIKYEPLPIIHIPQPQVNRGKSIQSSGSDKKIKEILSDEETFKQTEEAKYKSTNIFDEYKSNLESNQPTDLGKPKPQASQEFKKKLSSEEERKQAEDKRFGSASINVRDMIRNTSFNKNNVIGFKRQAVMISPFATSIINTVRPKQNNQNQLLPSAYAQEPINTQQESTNVMDQFITDIQNTMTGITKGNTRIGDTSIGQGVKTYQPDSSLNIFGGAYAENNKKTQLPTSTIGQLDKTNTKDTFGYVMVPPKPISDLESKTKINEVLREKYNIGLKSGEELKEMELNKYQFRHVYRFAQKITTDTPAKPKIPVPPIVPYVPTVPVVPRIITPPLFPVLGMPSFSNVKRKQNDTPKRKKKKTWWQTPENWYDPYYWGGKNQEGTGYITFTGKEPSRVKKYEKKFFGGI